MDPEINPKKSGSKGIVIIIIIILAVAGYFLFFKSKGATNTPAPAEEQVKIDALYNDFKNNSGLTAEQFAVLDATVSDRKIENIDTSSMQYSEGLGYKFKTPWGAGVISKQTEGSLELNQIEFPNQKKILLICTNQTPREALTAVDPQLGELLPKKDADQILGFLGAKADSSYEYVNLVFSLTTNSIKTASNLSSAEAISKLLVLKVITRPSQKQVYRFETGSVKGFQYGDYKTPQSTFVTVFPDNKAKCDIAAAEAQGLTQKDVDVIASTFTKVL